MERQQQETNTERKKKRNVAEANNKPKDLQRSTSELQTKGSALESPEHPPVMKHPRTFKILTTASSSSLRKKPQAPQKDSCVFPHENVFKKNNEHKWSIWAPCKLIRTRITFCFCSCCRRYSFLGCEVRRNTSSRNASFQSLTNDELCMSLQALGKSISSYWLQ